MGDPVIRMRGITRTFHSAAGEATVLKGIDVDVHQGEFISVVGRSGSGKSTLVNMLTRIDRPTSGTVRVGDVLIHELPEGRMALWRGRNMGVVFQFFQLLPMLTLVENVMLPMDFCNIYSPASREARALDLLKRVGLEGLAHKLPGAVAGGQQQSAAVARALANDPPILVADEPTGNLDSRTAEQVMGIFAELVEQGKTVVMVTHDQVLARRTSRIAAHFRRRACERGGRSRLSRSGALRAVAAEQARFAAASAPWGGLAGYPIPCHCTALPACQRRAASPGSQFPSSPSALAP